MYVRMSSCCKNTGNTDEWVTLISMSHVNINESCYSKRALHIYEKRPTQYPRTNTYVRMSGFCKNTGNTDEWVTLISMRHVNINESFYSTQYLLTFMSGYMCVRKYWIGLFMYEKSPTYIWKETYLMSHVTLLSTCWHLCMMGSWSKTPASAAATWPWRTHIWISHIWVSHVTYECIMAYLHESCHIYAWWEANLRPLQLLLPLDPDTHTYECVDKSHMSVISDIICDLFMNLTLIHTFMNKSHMSVMSDMNESWRATWPWDTHAWISHMWVLCQIWMSHDVFACVMSNLYESCHLWMSHVTYAWVMSHMNASCHIWMSYVTYAWVMSHMNASCHIWMSYVTYECVMSHMNESWHIWMSPVTYE